MRYCEIENWESIFSRKLASLKISLRFALQSKEGRIWIPKFLPVQWRIVVPKRKDYVSTTMKKPQVDVPQVDRDGGP